MLSFSLSKQMRPQFPPHRKFIGWSALFKCASLFSEVGLFRRPTFLDIMNCPNHWTLQRRESICLLLVLYNSRLLFHPQHVVVLFLLVKSRRLTSQRRRTISLIMSRKYTKSSSRYQILSSVTLALYCFGTSFTFWWCRSFVHKIYQFKTSPGCSKEKTR